MVVRGGENGEEVFTVRGTFAGKIGARLGNRVDLFVELTRECEAWQKINRRLVQCKQAQKAKITNNIKYIWY
ncbi:hypothetical protein T09_13329 [Trichinella sp. T9]|nr:hypothetical protein T09_13329 [Trichinella sp. T9]